MFFNKVQELLFLQKTVHEETSYDVVQCIKSPKFVRNCHYFVNRKNAAFLLEEITSFSPIYTKANSKHISLLPELPDYKLTLQK